MPNNLVCSECDSFFVKYISQMSVPKPVWYEKVGPAKLKPERDYIILCRKREIGNT